MMVWLWLVIIEDGKWLMVATYGCTFMVLQLSVCLVSGLSEILTDGCKLLFLLRLSGSAMDHTPRPQLDD
jgi:hypothetical protein